MYKKINELQPHFFSLREIKNTFSLDLILIINWSFENIVTKYENIEVKIQDKNTKSFLISLVTEATEDGFENIFKCGVEIVNYNKEMEEKKLLFLKKEEEINLLFNKKIEKLKLIFEKEPLDKLKNIDLNEIDETIIDEGTIIIADGDSQG